MAALLTGEKPLWDNWLQYVSFVHSHAEAIGTRVLQCDENAELIMDSLWTYHLHPQNRENAATVLKIAVERYIHDYHPDIAQIKGGYPKESHD